MGCNSSKNEGILEGEDVHPKAPRRRQSSFFSSSILASCVSNKEESFADDLVDASSSGSKIKSASKEFGHRAIVFIFGGLDSYKGEIVEMFAHDFGFTIISVEMLILEYLEDKLRKARPSDATQTDDEKSMHDSFSCLGAMREIITMELVLGLLSAKMKEKSEQSDKFIIDLIPNHKQILEQTDFLKQGVKIFARMDRSDFHTKCAIHVQTGPVKRRNMMRKASVLDQPPQSRDSSATSLSPSQSSLAPPSTSKPGASGTTSAATADEVDADRKHRRSLIVAASYEPFVGYFEVAQRLIRVRLCAPIWHIKERLKNVIKRQLDLPIELDTPSVLLFSTGKRLQQLSELMNFPISQSPSFTKYMTDRAFGEILKRCVFSKRSSESDLRRGVALDFASIQFDDCDQATKLGMDSIMCMEPGKLVVNGREVVTSRLKLAVYVLHHIQLSVIFTADCSEHLRRNILSSIQGAAKELRRDTEATRWSAAPLSCAVTAQQLLFSPQVEDI